MKIILTFLLYMFIFLATLYQPWDYDLGWHLKAGKDTLEAGYPYINTYSWELPGYQWFNSSALSDVPRYLVYKYVGMAGIAVLGSALAVSIFFFIGRLLRLNIFQKCLFFVFFLGFEYHTFVQSFKGQLITFLFLVILQTMLVAYQNGNKKRIYLLIPIFLIWANLHAQFVFGLVIFALFTAISTATYIKKHPISYLLPLAITLLASILVTCINPYGPSIYMHALVNTTNPQVFTTVEFTPPVFLSELFWELVVWGVSLFISIVFITKEKKVAQYLPWIIITILLYYLAFTMKRYVWPMYLLSAPVVGFLFTYILKKDNLTAKLVSISVLFVSFIFLFFVALPERKLEGINWDGYCRIVGCSKEGASILLTMNDTGKLYNYNSWGGWLIWNYPTLKPNVDGRMSFWVDKNGYNPVRQAMVTNTLSEYQVELSQYDTYFIKNDLIIYEELKNLSQRNKKWKRIFDNGKASIFTRMKYEK